MSSWRARCFSDMQPHPSTAYLRLSEGSEDLLGAELSLTRRLATLFVAWWRHDSDSRGLPFFSYDGLIGETPPPSSPRAASPSVGRTPDSSRPLSRPSSSVGTTGSTGSNADRGYRADASADSESPDVVLRPRSNAAADERTIQERGPASSQPVPCRPVQEGEQVTADSESQRPGVPPCDERSEAPRGANAPAPAR